MKKSVICFTTAWLVLIALTTMMSSCHKATYLRVDNDTINVTLEGNSGNIKIETDGSVEVAHAPQWAKTNINEENTNLHYEISLNTDRKLREDSIVLESSDLTCTIFVHQTFKATYIKFDKDTVTISKDGGMAEVNVEVDASSPLKIEDHSVAKTEGHKIIINMPANDGVWGKYKKLKVSCDDITAYLTIIQESNVCPKCNGEGFFNVPCPECGGIGLNMCCKYTGKKMCHACYGSGKAR